MLTGEIPSMDQIEDDSLRKIIFLLAIFNPLQFLISHL